MSHEAIVAEIYEKFLKDTPETFWSEGSSGEWEWIEKNRRFDFIMQLRNRDLDGLGLSLRRFPQSPAWFGVVTPSATAGGNKRVLWQQEVSLETFQNFHVLNNFLLTHPRGEGAQLLRSLGLSPRLLETTVPSPLDSSRFEATLLADSPRHLYFASKTLSCTNPLDSPRILEIGIGYGGGLNSLLKLAQLQEQKISVFGVDLPPTLVLAYYILRIQGWSVDVVLHPGDLPDETEETEADICLVSSHLAGDYPFRPSGVLNFRSFSEMGSRHSLYRNSSRAVTNSDSTVAAVSSNRAEGDWRAGES